MKTLRSILLLLFLTTLSALAQNDRMVPVRFAPGASSATVVEGIPRGDTSTFVLEAAAGQRMRIVCDSVEDNAEFDVISPGGWELGHSRPKNGRQVWYAELPHNGAYHVIVGTTRGGAEATITFEIW